MFGLLGKELGMPTNTVRAWLILGILSSLVTAFLMVHYFQKV